MFIIKKINLSNFNTSIVTNMSYMFSKCSSLIELDLSNFNIRSYTYMDGMFSGCLKELKKKIRIQNQYISI